MLINVKHKTIKIGMLYIAQLVVVQVIININIQIFQQIGIQIKIGYIYQGYKYKLIKIII
jgi:hypothetical protein